MQEDTREEQKHHERKHFQFKRLMRRRLSVKRREEEKQRKKLLESVVDALFETAKKAATPVAIALAILLLPILLIFLIMFIFGIFSDTSSGIMTGSYQSEPGELDGADAILTEEEYGLQKTIDDIETDHPGFDEYQYDLDPIGHDPFTLVNFLSARHGSFTASSVQEEVEALFDEMYTLTLTEKEETRTRTVPDEENGGEKEEEYTVKILEVKLEAKPLEGIAEGLLDGDALKLYQTYQQTGGALQVFYTPLDLDWQGLISSYYGHRKNPRTHSEEFHRGIDIAVPEGTEVLSAQDGTVTFSGSAPDYGNYIVIENEAGYVSKYAHLSEVFVSEGRQVSHGDVIGKTGSTGSVTGSHLHLECQFEGEYYNPLFYFVNGYGDLSGSTDPIGGGANAVLDEAMRYLGTPYVWGASNPAVGFDCSGFVCWVFTNSGAYSLPRTTAQGIYNRSGHITASEARPGDLVFFTGTYQSGNPVTHVGIYCGDGKMIHAGSPVKISSITTPYWQEHMYGFGRLLY